MPIDIADVAEVVFYNEDSASPMTVLKPAAFAAGELLLMVLGAEQGALSDLTAPAGWTLKGSWSDTPNCFGKVWSHMYNAADPSSWDFGYNGGSAVAGGLIRITGAESTPTIVTAATNAGQTGGVQVSPDLTPSGISDLLIVAMGATCGGTIFAVTDPTDTNNLGQTQVTGNFMALALGDRQLSSGSSIGAQTWTAITPATGPGGALSIAIKSTGFTDPDPPLRPPGAEIPPWLLDELLESKAQKFVGDQGAPRVKQYLSGGAAGSSVTLITAATTDSTDFLVCFHGNDWNQASNMTTPTGTAGTWTLQATGDGGNLAPHVKVWTRFAAAGANTVTCAPTPSAEEVTVHLFVLSGVDPVSPVDGAAGSNGTASLNHVAPSVDPASFNCLWLGVAQSGSSGAGNYTAPLGTMKQGEVDVGGFCTSASAIEVLATDQATGTRTFVTTFSDVWASASIAITPLAFAGGATQNADATLTATAAISVDASLVKSIDSTLAATTALTSAASAVKSLDAALSGAATLGSAGSSTKPVDATLTETATVSAVTAGVKAVDGSLTATAAISADASVVPAGKSIDAAITNTATITPAASLIKPVDSTITGTATISPTGATTKPVTSTLAGTATLTGAASLVKSIAATPSTTATIASDSALTKPVTASLTVTATLTAAAAVGGVQSATAAVNTSAALTATASVVKSLDATVAGTTTLAAAASAVKPAQITLAAAATITAVLTTAQSVSAALTVTASAALSMTAAPQITTRPNTGTTVRPNTGRTIRPYTGTTDR